MNPYESVSSLPAELLSESAEVIVRPFRPGRPLSEAARERLRMLAAMPDDTIDTSDIPEIPDSSRSTAVFNPYVPAERRNLRKAS